MRHFEPSRWGLQHPPSSTNPCSSAQRGLCCAKAKLDPAVLPAQHKGPCFLILPV